MQTSKIEKHREEVIKVSELISNSHLISQALSILSRRKQREKCVTPKQQLFSPLSSPFRCHQKLNIDTHASMRFPETISSLSRERVQQSADGAASNPLAASSSRALTPLGRRCSRSHWRDDRFYLHRRWHRRYQTVGISASTRVSTTYRDTKGARVTTFSHASRREDGARRGLVVPDAKPRTDKRNAAA